MQPSGTTRNRHQLQKQRQTKWTLETNPTLIIEINFENLSEIWSERSGDSKTVYLMQFWVGGLRRITVDYKKKQRATIDIQIKCAESR